MEAGDLVPAGRAGLLDCLRSALGALSPASPLSALWVTLLSPGPWAASLAGRSRDPSAAAARAVAREAAEAECR
jgi:hypothetical protein